jgi:hypothetical protein
MKGHPRAEPRFWLREVDTGKELRDDTPINIHWWRLLCARAIAP